jgi:tricorn protease
MVFEWCGDLWTARTTGGEAKRVMRHPARDAYPRFSPDGKRIVFSSERSGSLQVYSIPVDGGEAVRHTFHTEGNELECLSADGHRAIIRGMREVPGFRATRLMEIDLTADRRERRLFDATAHSAAWSPDGGSVLFCRGGEQLYRKGYRGSRSSQIWRFRMEDRRFECLISGEHEARSPVWQPDGKGFLFVSTEDGTANLWLRRDGESARQLTHFKDDGVITPALSADGSTILFRRGFGVFRYRPETEGEPLQVELWTREELPDVSKDVRNITGTTSADLTAAGDQVVFSAAGDLWLTPGPEQSCIRLTETPAAEDEVRFSPEGGWLYFLRDDGLQANYFRARLEGGELAGVTQVTRGERSKGWLKPSPDGSKIAWIEGNGDVLTAAADGANACVAYKCWDKPTFDWSPDGRWLAIAAEDRNANRDIRLVAADGGNAPVNLTNHPAFDGSPRWSPDGRALVFTSRRGNAGVARLWRIDFGRSGPSDASQPVLVPTDGIEPTRVIWAADSKSLFFQDARASVRKVYRIGADGKDLRMVAEQRGVPIRVTAGGDLLWRVDRTPELLTQSGGRRFPISVTVSRSREDVLTLGFRRIWRTLGERFHDPRMNGRDWASLRLKYEDAARTARDSRQFDRVVSQLFGELNASHLSFLRRPWPGETPKAPREEKTAHPGLVFRDDDRRPGAPLRIARVISGSPVSMQPGAPRPGERVLKIAGEAVSNGTPLHRFFNGAENRALPAVIAGDDGRERVIELRCISHRKARSLCRAEALDKALARVAAANPQAAYLRVPDMSRKTAEKLEVAVYQASLVSSSLILDLRDNGGGREADRMLGWFFQPQHAVTVPRGGPAGYPVERRPSPSWSKPLVVLCNEDTFSNSEIFCHAVKNLKRAPLVGFPTAGGVISAVKQSIPDVGGLQIPFRGWYDAVTGKNLDLHGARPDHEVPLTPEDEDKGRDPQLDMALDLTGN